MSYKLWQSYDEKGRAIAGQGTTKEDALGKGLPHGAAHVWIWRETKNGPEVLVQKRSGNKRTWPNRYDISAAGHIDLGEKPIETARRETKEEIGLNINESDLIFIGTHRFHIEAGDFIENEFQWIYLLNITDQQTFITKQDEVALLEWKSIEDFKNDIINSPDLYVPHGENYFQKIITAIESASTNQLQVHG